MKNLLLPIAAAVVTATAVTPAVTSWTTVQQPTHEQVNVDNLINLENQNLLLNNNKRAEVTPGGVNEFDYYFFYYDLFLNHKTTELINEHLKEGVAAITTLLIAAIPPLAPIAPIAAGALVLEWHWWDIDGNDKGDGVQIRFLGPGSLIIVGCWPQE